MNSICVELSKIGIIPVITLDRIADAEPLCEALLDAGLPVAEFTFRTSAAEEAIGIIRKKYPEMIVGAGTVTKKEEADRAVSAGAQYIVTPGFNRKNVEYIAGLGTVVIPGCATPGEIEQAMELSIDAVKIFPAQPLGGPAFIKALSGPYADMSFMPTGGINIDNLPDYLSCKNVFCCGGSWMVKRDLIDEGKFDKIRELTKRAVETAGAYTGRN